MRVLSSAVRGRRPFWLLSIAAVGLTGLSLVAQGDQARAAKGGATAPAPGKPIKVLVVGLSPAQASLYPQLASPLARRGIQLTPLTMADAATADRLAFYDVVMLPGKENERSPEQEKVIRSFKGPVFYASADADAATWSTPAFHTRIEEGIVAAVAEPARAAWKQLKMADVVYVDGLPIPNYENRDPVPRYQLPLSVQESMKFIQVPAEFSVELFASEPDIVKPISFNFDERGRLWLIETVDYPNKILNGQPGDDRIKILEDTNGDGRADKFTVFADRLNIPTSLTFANGGVIVSQSPHILFLKDTNGDDKADVREVLSTGWGIGDTHAGPSNLQYAPDNYIWGSVGYSGFKGEMNGKPMQFSQGLFRFRPDGRDFEFITASTNNTWGLGFTETFDVFGSTANNEPSFYAAIPNRYFDGIEGLPAARGGGPGYQSIAAFYSVHPLTPYIRQVDVHGGYTAAAGHNIYTARAFPKEYWNRDRVHHRTHRPSGRAGHPREAGRWIRDARWMEPLRRFRRVGGSNPRAGRPGRGVVGVGLVQLHHATQSDAARVQQRSGERFRDVSARSTARSDLPRGL